jgi:radical SAM family RiPP maturation amino acid epimerase
MEIMEQFDRYSYKNNEQLQKLEPLSNLDEIDTEVLTKVSHIKRFCERWRAHPEFREQMTTDPYGTVVRYGLQVDPEEIRQLWDTESAQKSEQQATVYPSVKIYQEFDQKIDKSNLMISLAASAKEPRFKAWRERQIARAASQFKQAVHKSIVHAPVCFELSKGCSVGCKFCAVSAPPLTNIFFYTPENARLWREVLEVVREILGPAASASFCYWATDPFDNPDYEKFCIDLHEITGVFPQTTTSQPLKDPARTRKLLTLSREKKGIFNRFSILSLKMLDRVHEEFSAEELAFVKLVLLNEEAGGIKAYAGRERERNLKKGNKDIEYPEQGTIACVSGFLFNMVDRSVKLISPCNADERWPLGYIVYAEGNFSNASDLKVLLERMIADHMPLTVKSNDLMNFRRDLKYESLPNGFKVSTKFKSFKFQDDNYLRELGEAIHKGNKTAGEIASFLFDSYSISPTYTFYNFNVMFEKGILDSEPKASQVKS